jgi:hypothetical protein
MEVIWGDYTRTLNGSRRPSLDEEMTDILCERMSNIYYDLEHIRSAGTTHIRFGKSTSSQVMPRTSPDLAAVNIVNCSASAAVAESHPKVLAYVKNHNLGLEVPSRFGSVMRKYLPDFIVLVDDGHGPDDLLHLVVEIKGSPAAISLWPTHDL